MKERHIVLVGLMSSGKSTVGPLLAERLGRRRLDSDEDIEERYGRMASRIAEEEGLERLHEIEHAHLLDALATAEPAVIATAASTADCEDCLRAMEEPFVVWLQLDVEEIARRYAEKGHRRDLGADPVAALNDQLARRGPAWARVADIQLDDAKHDPERAVNEIVATARTAGAVTGPAERYPRT
jgi:shikimate kinase